MDEMRRRRLALQAARTWRTHMIIIAAVLALTVLAGAATLGVGYQLISHRAESAGVLQVADTSPATLATVLADSVNCAAGVAACEPEDATKAHRNLTTITPNLTLTTPDGTTTLTAEQVPQALTNAPTPVPYTWTDTPDGATASIDGYRWDMTISGRTITTITITQEAPGA